MLKWIKGFLKAKGQPEQPAQAQLDAPPCRRGNLFVRRHTRDKDDPFPQQLDHTVATVLDYQDGWVLYDLGNGLVHSRLRQPWEGFAKLYEPLLVPLERGSPMPRGLVW